jgi:selenocysteine lyase/cysteine desulfurase
VQDIQSFIGNVEKFPILAEWDYFNHAGVAPLPDVAAEALRFYAAGASRSAYLHNGFYEQIEQVRTLCARLIHATAAEIAFVKNTSEGISIVARGIDWQWGDRIVTCGVEYPANIYPWMEVERSRGARLVLVPEQQDADGARRVPTEAILEAASDPKCRLVALSHVQFASGQRMDLARIGTFCREQGKLFCVDAIQSLGVLPTDVQEFCIDFLSADSHKWMLGPEGAGFFYCRAELLERVRPLMIGWNNVVDAQNYGNYDFTLKPDAGRFECGTYNLPGILAMGASIELLLGVGVEAIEKRVLELGDRLIQGLRGKGYRIVSPRGAEASGSVCFISPQHDHKSVVRTLRRVHRTEIALREGRLRASPHFYNTEAQIDRLIRHLPGH